MSTDQQPLSCESPAPAHLDFVVGQDGHGHWVALETHGLGGGLFVSEIAAIRYAAGKAGCARGSVRIASTAIDFRL